MLAVAGIVVSLAQTLVVPILGSLPQIFNAPASDTSWIITITLLVGAVSTPVLGRLADMYGKRRLILLAMIPFILGSVLCAVSGSLVWMIIGRALQGVATGVVPLGISLLHDILPKERVGAAIALMSSSMGIGGALGLPIAAAVSQYADWRVLFWATAALAALVTVAIIVIIPAQSSNGATSRFDYVGFTGLAIGLVTLLLGISKGAEWGWTSPLTLGLLVAAVVVLIAWGAYEVRRPAPLVDLRTTVRPVVLLTNLASILIGFAMYAMNLIIPQLMQLPVDLGYGLGQSMVQMGLWLAPMGLGMMLVSNLGARISRAKGPKITLFLAGLVVALGYGLAALVAATIGNRPEGGADAALITWTLILYMLAATVAGCGIGLGLGGMPALILGAVPASEKAAANGFNSLMRSLGTTISAAVVGVVLATMVRPLGEHRVPTMSGFLVALLIGAGAALAAAVIAISISGRPSATAGGAH